MIDSGGEKHGGVLIRGATGDLYFLRDDRETPEPVIRENAPDAEARRELKRRFEAYAQNHEKWVSHDIDEDILDLLDDIFGPLWGAWWIWGPRLGG